MKQKRIMSLAGALVILMSAVGLLTSCLQSNSVLEGNVFKGGDDRIYYYFSGGVVYAAVNYDGVWKKHDTGMTYKGKTVNDPTRGSIEAVVKGDGIDLSGVYLKKVTDQALIDKIKNLPVTKQ